MQWHLITALFPVQAIPRLSAVLCRQAYRGCVFLKRQKTYSRPDSSASPCTGIYRLFSDFCIHIPKRSGTSPLLFGRIRQCERACHLLFADNKSFRRHTALHGEPSCCFYTKTLRFFRLAIASRIFSSANATARLPSTPQKKPIMRVLPLYRTHALFINRSTGKSAKVSLPPSA